jgi:hypothetical protein
MIAVFSNVESDPTRLDQSVIGRATSADIFVFLNTAAPLSLPVVARHDNKVLVRRWHRKLRHYHGFAPVGGQFCGLYFLEGPKHNLPGAPWLEDYPGYPELIPTTGFWVWRLLRDGFLQANDDVFLVNFLGSRDESTFKAKIHNWAFEEKFIRDHHDSRRLLDVR